MHELAILTNDLGPFSNEHPRVDSVPFAGQIVSNWPPAIFVDLVEDSQ